MKKLFKAIRNNDLEEVKAILQKYPEAISCIAVPPPKKDAGQSPLMVAVKAQAFEIAHYLITHGADVNFMESGEEGKSGWQTPVLHDAVRTVLISLCYKKIDVSNNALELTGELLAHGADPNKCASNGFAALDECVAKAEYILDNREAYPQVQEIAEQQLYALLDLLIKYGADFRHWAEKDHFPQPQGETNKARYLDDFVPSNDSVIRHTIHGKEMETVVKGDVDATEHTRAVMQAYCQERRVKHL